LLIIASLSKNIIHPTGQKREIHHPDQVSTQRNKRRTDFKPKSSDFCQTPGSIVHLYFQNRQETAYPNTGFIH
jgi:hypothetical protein